MMHVTHRNGKRNQRRGVSAVEFAVVLPMVVFLMFGAIEASRAVMVQHALQEASQAACRVYSVEQTTKQDAQDMVDRAMTEAGITGYSVTFQPLTKAEVDHYLEPVSITVAVPNRQIAWLGTIFLPNATITGQCTMPADVGTLNTNE